MLLKNWYRICVVNDFTETYTYISLFQSGDLKDLQICKINGQHKGYQEKDDRIGIYFNYNRVLLTNNKAEAKKCLDDLIAKCPKDLEQHIKILYDSL